MPTRAVVNVGIPVSLTICTATDQKPIVLAERLDGVDILYCLGKVDCFSHVIRDQMVNTERVGDVGPLLREVGLSRTLHAIVRCLF